MKEQFFKINYVFGKEKVWQEIENAIGSGSKGYIAVADGVILTNVQKDEEYKKVIDGSLFAICDSSWVPMYIKWIYGIKREQYCGSQIFKDIIASRKYRMMFMGTSQPTLDGLKKNLAEQFNPDCENMTFYSLPYLTVDEFDYPGIAKMIEDDGADIIWVALGAPKQEQFMARLNPYLKRGVQIAVGAAFKFYSGTSEKRAPEWVVKHHMEFIYRIIQDPKKQIKRCWGIVSTLPGMLWGEWKRKRASASI